MLTYDSDTIYYEEEVPEFEDTVTDLYIETNEKEIAGKKITKEIEELLNIKSAYAH